ncbi:unnamed protein product [Fraxinus pennsylvanica]|uniref:60S acidic ribosomal protein P0 n=1 Tax=Fraxinus pennsylvanica TaxID=56036 RepID=A0AAD2DU77_9LAMI|nr:unnamed protein product [Fraxinus pennsylvanica]
MAPKVSKAEKKIAYDSKLCQLLDDYTQVLVAAADNVGSKQLQNIQKGLRGDFVVLMGKNTMMKRSIRIRSEKTGNQAILNLIPLLVGNVGLIFTKGDLKEVSEEVAKYKVGAPARVGLVPPVDVVVPPGNTGLDPSQTSFFQILNIPTKLWKSSPLWSSSRRVTNPEVLDLTEDDLIEKFALGVSMVTSLSLAISYPTLAAAPHMFINAYKNVLAVAVETDYSYPLADKVKEYLECSLLSCHAYHCPFVNQDPTKFAVAAAPVAAADSGATPAAAKEEEKKEEPAEESDDDMGFSLFD